LQDGKVLAAELSNVGHIKDLSETRILSILSRGACDGRLPSYLPHKSLSSHLLWLDVDNYQFDVAPSLHEGVISKCKQLVVLRARYGPPVSKSTTPTP
jgi:hypothetical protein